MQHTNKTKRVKYWNDEKKMIPGGARAVTVVEGGDGRVGPSCLASVFNLGPLRNQPYAIHAIIM